MLTVLVFAITLGILVFVHELGHFLVARKNGIRAEEFGFGFPPRIFGFQVLRGKKMRKVAEKEDVSIEISDKKKGNTEVIEEIISDKIIEVDELVSVKKYRFIWGKRNTDKEWENKENLEEGTIYSINWIPLGGFVRIKGEDGSDKKDKDSFSGKPSWVRVKVLGAGIIMNFVLAWFAISLGLFIGSPQALDDGQSGKDSKIQIAQVISGTPAEKMGIKAGDEIVGCDPPAGGDIPECQQNFSSISDVQNLINGRRGQEIILEIKRGKESLTLKGEPRVDYPEDQGALGISLVRTAVVSYPWYEAIYKGLTTVFNLIWLIAATLFSIIKDLIVGQKVSVDVSGPIGIAYLTKQVTDLGFTYILQFIALLSINLGIINGLPFPALDGGRILFILIEKIKGKPVSQKVEQFAHTFGFIALIVLMILVTFKDLMRFDILDKIKNLF
ncbi:MAG: RIP metalloprotease RseP [Parcubacteria group bacterium]|jgi:regulator of sigma E protease